MASLKKANGIDQFDDPNTDVALDPSTIVSDPSAITDRTDIQVPNEDHTTNSLNSVAGGPGSQSITGTAGDDCMDGGPDADTMAGGDGNDVYYVDDPGDVVVEAANGGIETVITLIDYTIPDNAEALYVVGTSLTGTGSNGNDILLSDFAANTLIGLDGGDLYYVRHTDDTVIEAANGGHDIILAECDYTMPANIEALYVAGTGLTGTGTSDDDTLLSAGGVNALVGLDGNDLYYVSSPGDTVVEAENGGTDTIIALSTDYTIADNVEALYMVGTGLTGTGSANNDILLSEAGPFANSGDFNTLIGLAGDDLYHVRQTGDIVIEAANEGNDTIVATVDYTIADNVETMYMIGTGLTGTGSAAGETLISIGANTLVGGGGDDTFMFFSGSADGAIVGDFGEADRMLFNGFGTEADGATFTQVAGTDDWIVHSGLDNHDETITFTNHATPTDFMFV